MVHHIPLDKIEEIDLQRLVSDQIGENYRLEFKLEANIASDGQKHELAKDASALANTAGGRIIFGIREQELEDGTRCAGELVGLESIDEEALLNVLVNRTAPPVRARTRGVSLRNGRKALVLEVEESMGVALHQVTGKQGGRFYRRDDKGVRPMAEPEIREAFLRLLAAQGDLDARFEQRRNELSRDRGTVEEIVTIIPWFGREDQVRPQDFSLEGSLFKRVQAAARILRSDLDVSRFAVDGQGVYLPGLDDPSLPSSLLRIAKDGSVAISTKSAVSGPAGGAVYFPFTSLRLMVGTLLVAREVQTATHYHGPSEVAHRVPVRVQPSLQGVGRVRFPPDGSYLSRVRDFRAQVDNPTAAARQLLDEVFHLAGRRACHYFDDLGNLQGDATKLAPFLD